MQHSTIKLTETQEVTMFQPVTITDREGDKTVVMLNGVGGIVVKIQDQSLLDADTSEATADAAYGAYGVEEAKQLRDALSAAIADVEARQPGPDAYQFIDRYGYLWVFVPEHDAWACGLTPRDSADDFSIDHAASSPYKGFDAWTEIVERFAGIQA